MPPIGRRRLCLGAVAALGGCGFQPVYMPTASHKTGAAPRGLQSVFVAIIPERPGQELREALQERFGSDSGTPSAYELQVSFGIAGEGIAIENNAIATRIRMTGNATWLLHAHDAKRTVLTSGSARYIDGLNVFDAEYFAADLESEAVQRRIAEEIAQQITTQLAIWFRKQAGQQAG
nr:LPS assembly lipoprotein LptE [uncultured Rhodopila sp.]